MATPTPDEWDAIVAAYEDFKLQKAFELLQKLDRPLDDAQKRTSEKITRRWKEVQKVLTEMEETWEIVRNDDIHVSFKLCGDGGNLVKIKVEGVIEAEDAVFRLGAIVNECHLFHEWVPFCGDVDDVAQLSLFEKAVHYKTNLPMVIPFSNRDSVVHAYAVDLLEERQCLVIVGETLTESDEFEVPDVAPKHVRASGYGGAQAIVEGPNRVFLRVVLCVDPKIPLLPNWVLNFALKKLSNKVIQLLRKRAAVPDFETKSQYAACLVEHKEVYDDIRKRLQTFHEARESEE